ALREQGITCVSFQDWQHIDAVERQRGASAGKVRDRFTAVEEALAALDKAEQ
ncbi:MAG: NADP oxidoreductase, partial [Candidatus Hydrogenedentes bacterium]|nr:NADP oxidoreductase [Candidatus Hydrogenedentota bacterium]